MFERVVGRAPSAEEVREALAIADVVRQSNVDPILMLYLVDRRGQDARERAEAQIIAAAARVESGLNSKPADDLSNRLTRIENIVSRLVPDAGARSEAGLMRDLCVFAVALLVCVAAFVGMSRVGGPLALVAAMAFGVCLALAYVWLSPIVADAIRRWR
jgi:hypothetical protein